MGEMQMPLPTNTLPMMTGQGPYGGVEMGGMFTVVKIRPNLSRSDYTDPGWYRAPAGTVAYLWEGNPPPATREPVRETAPASVEVKVRKPSDHMNH